MDNGQYDRFAVRSPLWCLSVVCDGKHIGEETVRADNVAVSEWVASTVLYRNSSSGRLCPVASALPRPSIPHLAASKTFVSRLSIMSNTKDTPHSSTPIEYLTLMHSVIPPRRHLLDDWRHVSASRATL